MSLVSAPLLARCRRSSAQACAQLYAAHHTRRWTTSPSPSGAPPFPIRASASFERGRRTLSSLASREERGSPRSSASAAAEPGPGGCASFSSFGTTAESPFGAHGVASPSSLHESPLSVSSSSLPPSAVRPRSVTPSASLLSRAASLALPPAAFPLPPLPPPGSRVAVALSGGVDSAAVACLLRDAGLDCRCVFMRNWDEREEGSECSADADARRARAVADRLGLPFAEVDFVSAYWTRVFSSFLQGIEEGKTPNPDLACNRHIKFDLLLTVAQEMGCDHVATGHYARVLPGEEGGEGGEKGEQGDLVGASTPRVQADPAGDSSGTETGGIAPPSPLSPSSSRPRPLLYRGLDRNKDQSYFLASVQPDSLDRVIFPLGLARSKDDVRAYAHARGLVPTHLKSSAGICFVGRRKFGAFLNQYVEPLAGTFVALENDARDKASTPAPTHPSQPAPSHSSPAAPAFPTAAGLRPLAACPDLQSVTVGQRAPVGGAATRLYVAGKDSARRLAYVVAGSTHPALRARAALLGSPAWLDREVADFVERGGELRCHWQARYRQSEAGTGVVRRWRGRHEDAEENQTGEERALDDTVETSREHPSLSGLPRSFSTPTSGAPSLAAWARLVARARGDPALERRSPDSPASPGHSGSPPSDLSSRFVPSALTRLRDPAFEQVPPDALVIVADEPGITAPTPGQEMVLYLGDRCLGAAELLRPGATDWELQEAARETETEPDPEPLP